MDLSLPRPTAHGQLWNFESRLEDSVSVSWPSSDTSSTRSDVDSAESTSTYQGSPVPETPLETPLGSAEGYFSHVRDSEPPVVAVVGVGYVGLHLVTTFSGYYKVIAFDVSEKRLASVAGQFSSVSNVSLTSDSSRLAAATHFLVAVPTPLVSHSSKTDTSMIESALDTICDQVRPGATIVIESSVSVGMTRSLLSKMVHTYNLYAGMSPERVDPGRVDPPYESIPKIISGLDDIAPGSLESIQKLYSPVFQNLVPVSSPEAAEMTKLYENCQRMVCIAYANEMADACHALPHPIDPFEVSRAAATKPFGYLPLTPSAGVGGHCIPVNPNYLFSTSTFPILQHATEIMSKRPAMLADRAMRALLAKDRDPALKAGERKQKVLVVGVAFKAGQELTTNSPAVGIIQHLLESWDAYVAFADPLVSQQALPYVPRLDDSQEWNKEHLNQFGLIIVVMKQRGLDFDVLKELDGVVIEKYCQ